MPSRFSRASKPSSSSTTAICRARSSNSQRTGARTKCCGTWKRCCWSPTPSNTYILSGNGDVIEPDEEVAAIGSGGPFAKSAATALMREHQAVARARSSKKSMTIAGKICIYTNENIIFEELELTW